MYNVLYSMQVFPTVENVRNSLEGYMGNNIITVCRHTVYMFRLPRTQDVYVVKKNLGKDLINNLFGTCCVYSCIN